MKYNRDYIARIIWGLSILLGLSACTNENSSVSADTEPNMLMATAPFELLEIPPDTARSRIKRYNTVYGDQHRRLTSSNDHVLVPRYFVINSQNYGKLLEGDTSKTLYASLGVKARKDKDSERDTSIADLIFHDVRPAADGSVKDIKGNFYDSGNACPIDCGDSYDHGGYNGASITADTAMARINRYNEIYGGAEKIVYLPSANPATKDSVLLARYYSFSRSDLKQLLSIMKEKHQFFYVSIGAQAELDSQDRPIPNTFVSDLIFHEVRPDAGGGLKVGDDTFYDVTRPCPRACGGG